MMNGEKKYKRLKIAFFVVLGALIVVIAVIVYRSIPGKKAITVIKEENIPQGLIVTGKSCRGVIRNILVDPSNSCFISSENCTDGTAFLRRWKAYHGEEKTGLKVNASEPRFAVSDDAKFLAVCDYKNPGRIRMYDLEELTYKDLQISPDGYDGIIDRFSLSPDGQFLLIAYPHEIRIFDLRALKKLESKKFSDEYLAYRWICLPSMRNYFLTLSYSVPVEDAGSRTKHFRIYFRIWDYFNSKAIFEHKTEDTCTLNENQGDEPRVIFENAETGPLVVWNKKLLLFDDSGKGTKVAEKDLEIHPDETGAIAFLKENNKPDRLILANDDGVVYQYDLSTGSKSILTDLRKHLLAPLASAVSVTSCCVVYASASRLIVYDHGTNKTRILE